jgi:hypothetical protein
MLHAEFSVAHAAEKNLDKRIQALMAQHPGKTGAYFLEKGEVSLLGKFGDRILIKIGRIWEISILSPNLIER